MPNQPVQKFYCCEKCDKVGDYWILPGGSTTFDRGEFLGHRDYLTASMDTLEEAEKALLSGKERTAQIAAMKAKMEAANA